MFANDHFRQIDSTEIDIQTEFLGTNGLTVYKMIMLDDAKTVYAVMGNQGVRLFEDGSLDMHANLYCIDLE